MTVLCDNCSPKKGCTAEKNRTECKYYQTMTNEEWFCQLPTEEKAKFLFEHGVISCNFCNGNCVEIDYKTKECKYNVSPSYSYTGIVEWLKQPHTDKE